MNIGLYLSLIYDLNQNINLDINLNPNPNIIKYLYARI